MVASTSHPDSMKSSCTGGCGRPHVGYGGPATTARPSPPRWKQ